MGQVTENMKAKSYSKNTTSKNIKNGPAKLNTPNRKVKPEVAIKRQIIDAFFVIKYNNIIMSLEDTIMVLLFSYNGRGARISILKLKPIITNT
jgi:hypothetical protein